MDKKRLQMLVSAVNKKALDLPGIMNIDRDTPRPRTKTFFDEVLSAQEK